MIDIKNFTDRGEIYVYGMIVDDTDASELEDGSIGYVFPAKIREQLESLNGLPVDVHIASDGGNVAAGVALYNMLENHNGPITVFIDSWAASIASYLAFVGQKIVMAKNTFLMIHNPAGGAFGSSDYLRSVADWLDKIKTMIANKYKENSQMTMETIFELMDKETWFTADEAKEAFPEKVEVVSETNMKAVACFSSFKTAPDALKIAFDTNTHVKEENASESENEALEDKNDFEASEEVLKNIFETVKRGFDYEEES